MTYNIHSFCDTRIITINAITGRPVQNNFGLCPHTAASVKVRNRFCFAVNILYASYICANIPLEGYKVYERQPRGIKRSDHMRITQYVVTPVETVYNDIQEKSLVVIADSHYNKMLKKKTYSAGRIYAVYVFFFRSTVERKTCIS